MAKYSENTKQLIFEFPVVSILTLMGRNTDHFGYMYYSPFNAERTPSFHIKKEENKWYDHSAGMGGGPVKLVSLLLNITMDRAMDWIAERLGTPVEIVGRELDPNAIDGQGEGSIIIESVDKRIMRRALLNYGSQRGIPLNILQANCVQVNYHMSGTPDNHYYAIGFRSNREGYALSSSSVKLSTKNLSATFLDVDGKRTEVPSSDRVMVFEGFFDYLSWLSLMGRESPKACDVVVLNSISHLSKSLPFILLHPEVGCNLDNDRKGIEATGKIFKAAEECGWTVNVTDKSGVYSEGGFKDLNEFWVSRCGLKPVARERKRKVTASQKL